MKLLEIQSSPSGGSSDSITGTKSFIKAGQSDNNSVPETADRGNLLMFDQGDGPDLRNRVTTTALSLTVERNVDDWHDDIHDFPDMRHCALSGLPMLGEASRQIGKTGTSFARNSSDAGDKQAAVDSLLQFGSSGRNNPLIKVRLL